MSAIPDVAPTALTLRQALPVWARIGLLGFGGPAGQIALMHRELVESRRWIGETRFLQALNYCMLLPGPEAQQLAIYIGWLLHRTRGGIVAGVLFVLPGALVLAVLSAIYVRFGGVPWVEALFFGLKAAVLAIVAEATLRIGRRALKTGFQRGVAIAAFLAIYALQVPFPLIVLGAALLGMAAWRARPRWLPATNAVASVQEENCLIDRAIARGEASHLRPSWSRALRIALVCLLLWWTPVLLVAGWLGTDHTVTQQGVFFSQTAVVTFGGAYAVLAYVAQRAVEDFAWLTPAQMLDGLALAETTPGPLILVLQFVGFVGAYGAPGGLDPWAAAALGAALTVWVTFVPSFLFIFVGAPYIEALRANAHLQAALSTITAAVVGVILNLAVWFALHSVFARIGSAALGPFQVEYPVLSSVEPGALVLTLMAMVAMLRFKLAMGRVLLGSAVLGAAYWGLRYGF